MYEGIKPQLWRKIREANVPKGLCDMSVTEDGVWGSNTSMGSRGCCEVGVLRPTPNTVGSRLSYVVLQVLLKDPRLCLVL